MYVDCWVFEIELSIILYFSFFCHLFSLGMIDLGWITSRLFGICTIYEANSKSVTIQAKRKIPRGFHFLKP